MITQINILALTRLLLSAHAQFHKQVLEKATSYDLALLHIEELMPVYTTAVEAEIKAVNRPTSFVETAQMVEADHQRDQSISMIDNIINLYKRSTIKSELEAAHRLEIIIAPYQGIQASEYYKETTEIDGLLTALATADSADIVLLNLTSAIEQLNTHNTTFKSLMTDRSGDVVARTPIRLTDSQELRHTSDKLYLEIVQRVNAFAIAIPSPELETFTVAINAIILQLQHVLAGQGRGHKVEETADEAVEETEPIAE